MEMNIVTATAIEAAENGTHRATTNRQHQAGQPNAGAATVLSPEIMQRGPRNCLSVRHQMVYQLG